ncbi:hypothetical protein Tco_0996799, partial [Tanacetum coccineum]
KVEIDRKMEIVASTCHGYAAVAAVAVLLKRLAAVVPAPYSRCILPFVALEVILVELFLYYEFEEQIQSQS